MFNKRFLCMILSAVLSSSLLTAISLDDDPNTVLAQEEAVKILNTKLEQLQNEATLIIKPIAERIEANQIVENSLENEKIEHALRQDPTYLQLLMVKKQKERTPRDPVELSKLKADAYKYVEETLITCKKTMQLISQEIQLSENENGLQAQNCEKLAKYFKDLVDSL